MKLKVLVNRFVAVTKSLVSFSVSFGKQKTATIKEGAVSKIPVVPLVKGPIIIAAILLVFLLLAYLNAFKALLPYYTEAVPEFGGIYSESIAGSFSRFNPVYSQTNLPDADADSLIFSGLTKFNSLSQIEGDLAESWSSDGTGKVYTFILKQNVKWHDGVDFTADDVVFTYSKITEPDAKSPLRGEWAGVRVEKVDDRTVKFLLPNPYSAFLSKTSQGIIAKHIFESVPARSLAISEANQSPVGTGPFAFAGLTKISEDLQVVRLERFELYFGGRPYFDGVQLKAYLNAGDAFNAFANKQVTAIADIPVSQYPTATKYENLAINKHETGRVLGVFINTKSAIYSSRGVRRALNIAVNKKKILDDVFYGQGALTNRLFRPGYDGYQKVRPDENAETFDLTKAFEGLAAEGWEKSEAGVLAKGDQIFVLRLVGFDTPEMRAAAAIIAEDLKTLGIQVEVHLEEPATLEDNFLRPRNFDMFITTFSLGYESDPYPIWHSTQIDGGMNFSAFNNVDADRYLENARRTTKPEVRAARLYDFENVLLSEMPTIFILSPNYLHGTLKTTDEAVKIPKEYLDTRIVRSYDRYRGITAWYIKEKHVERSVLNRIK